MILVSSCLLGMECRYDGSHNEIAELLEFLEDKLFIPICPEQIGGLTTPREPAEIIVENGVRVVKNKLGQDVTKEFIKGAEESLKLAKLGNAKYAILKAKSPSCGSQNIYDGTFSKVLIEGQGLTSELLKENGLEIFNENNYREILGRIKNEK